MVSNLPKSPQKANLNSFSDIVNHYMKIKGKTQSDLVRSSALSKTTISRICRNSNDKGSSYLPTPSVVMTIGVGLGLSGSEIERLFVLAFPEIRFWKKIANKHLNIFEANQVLYENGLPLLGNSRE